jgi:signal transduction histidine kinase
MILMSLFFLFHFMLTSRPLFSVRRFMENDGMPSLLPLFGLGIILAWFLLEAFEFLAWDYRWASPGRGRIITALRLAPVCTLVLLDPGAIPGLMGITAPILTFYLSLLFSRGGQYVVLATFCTLQGLLSLWLSSRMPAPEPDRQYELVILVYQVMSIVLMFLFARFWREQRVQREHQAALTVQLEASHQELRRYASRVSYTVALEERTRIARDIHDSLGHTLTAVSIQLNKAEAFFRKDPEVSRRAILDARSSMQEAMLDVRSTLDTLASRAEGFDLAAQIKRPLESLSQAGLRVHSEIQGSQEGCTIAVLLALYRFVQEGSTNILRHARAREVWIELRFGDQDVVAGLRDDGAGFDTDAVEKNPPGYGLAGLADRIGLVRGRFSVDSAPGRGTSLRAVLPKDPVSLMGKGAADVAD